jgi:plasmid maintenance system killer protein
VVGQEIGAKLAPPCVIPLVIWNTKFIQSDIKIVSESFSYIRLENYIFFVSFNKNLIFAPERYNDMNISFNDEDLMEFCSTGKSKKNKYKKYTRNKTFMSALTDVISALLYASSTKSLPSFLHYEKLTHDRSGQSSVRILNGWAERLIFTEDEEGIEIVLLELNSEHYGRKK